MPAIHSKTLFHFTNQDGLIGILKSNFRTGFVKERIVLKNEISWDYWVPAICFCDIPLHLISEHLAQYGQYGLGLSREWALSQGLNPVFYYQSGSLLFSELDSLLELQHKDVEGLNKLNLPVKSIRDAYLKNRYVLQYYKPWFGYDFKANKQRHFYDEREWRYVPADESNYESIHNDDEEFQNNRDKYFAKLKDPYLVFEPKDINYIVLRSESERHGIIQNIREIKNKFSLRDVEILLSKIITVEQIENDI